MNKIYDFCGVNEAAVTAEMLTAAGAKITYAAMISRDYPAGISYDYGELTPAEYADMTAHVMTSPEMHDGLTDRRTYTSTYVSGVGAVVTQTIHHVGKLCITRDYHITVDTESDDYYGATVRRCRAELGKWAEGYADWLRAIASNYDIDSHRKVEINGKLAVDDDDDNIDIDDYVRNVTAAPESEDEGITGVITEYSGFRVYRRTAMIPVAVTTREVVALSPTVALTTGAPDFRAVSTIEYDIYPRYSEALNTDSGDSYHVWSDSDDDHNYNVAASIAEYCGARPY